MAMNEYVLSFGVPIKAHAASYSRFVVPFAYRLLDKTGSTDNSEFEYRRICACRPDRVAGNKIVRQFRRAFGLPPFV
jgi:hypothetical protein